MKKIALILISVMAINVCQAYPAPKHKKGFFYKVFHPFKKHPKRNHIMKNGKR